MSEEERETHVVSEHYKHTCSTGGENGLSGGENLIFMYKTQTNIDSR